MNESMMGEQEVVARGAERDADRDAADLRRREAELPRDSDARYACAFESSAIGLEHIDLRDFGRLLRVNERLCEMTGYTRAELLRRTFQDITHPDDLEPDLTQAKQLRTGELTAYSLEKRYLRKDGQIFWGRVTRSVVRTPSGEPDFAISIVEDITDRKRAEAALRETERWLWLAQAAGGVGLFTGDIATREACCSEHFFDVVGRARGTATVTFDELERWVHPEDLERVMGEIRLAVHGTAERVDSELRVLGEHGEARWISFRGEIRRDERGDPKRVLGAIQDITARKRSEEQLREAHERLALALKAAHAGLWDWEVERGPAAFVSPEYRELYGFTADEPVTHQDWIARIHPDDRERVRAHSCKVITQGREYAMEYRIDHPTRGVRWIGDTGRAYRDAEGQPRRFTGINRDITALKRTEEALRESEERFREVFEHAAIGISITNIEGQIEQCNPALTSLVGYSADELRRMNFASLVHPEDRPANLAELRRLLAGEVAFFELENRYVRKDGEAIWVRKWVSVLRDDAGQPAHTIALVTDITEQRRAERELRASEGRLRRVIDSMFAFVGVVGTDGTVIEINRAPLALVGLTRDEVLGHKLWECRLWSYDPAVRARLEAAFDRAVHGEVVRYDETIWVAKERLGADRMVIDFQLQPVFEGEQVCFVIPSAVDITERKRAEEALKESDRRKDEFLATLAHELRNPLAPIRTGFEVMRSSSDRATRERAREMMERQLQHMVHLIDDLLDVSRISRGKVELKRETVAVQVVVQHAVETASPLIEARKVSFATRMPDVPVWINGDLTRLAQVVGNLLNNATKYTPEGGHIELAVAVEEGQAVIRVRDDGVGIAPEMLPVVFDLFAQAARDRGRAQGGLGIGLFLVRRLVEMHGGTITVESAGPDRGSTFTVRIPLAAEPRPAADPPAQGVQEEARRRRILVVDDNEDAAELLATVLDLHGYETRVANDGPSALAVARQFTPDVAFLDIGLPGMSGHELARELRADPALAGTVLIALTGWGGDEDKQRTKESGFNHHLTKPVDVAAIKAVLARC